MSGVPSGAPIDGRNGAPDGTIYGLLIPFASRIIIFTIVIVIYKAVILSVVYGIVLTKEVNTLLFKWSGLKFTYIKRFVNIMQSPLNKGDLVALRRPFTFHFNLLKFKSYGLWRRLRALIETNIVSNKANNRDQKKAEPNIHFIAILAALSGSSSAKHL